MTKQKTFTVFYSGSESVKADSAKQARDTVFTMLKDAGFRYVIQIDDVIEEDLWN